MLWFVPLNILLFYLTKYPRRTLNQNTFHFTYNSSLKNTSFEESEVTKLIKKIIIKTLKPFLVRDHSNNLSLYCFCNSLLALIVLDLSSVLESLFVSINAACIFHYIVIAIPNEKHKVASLRKLSLIIKPFKYNDDTLYSMLGYQSESVDLSNFHTNDLERLKTKLAKRMDELVGGSHTYSIYNWDKLNILRVKSDARFSQVWEYIIQYDGQFLTLVKDADLTLFPSLTIAIEHFYQQHNFLTTAEPSKTNPEVHYRGYLVARQNVIAEYINTAANYTHGHEQRFMNFKGV
ncbi:hypothetical protein [Vibrio splendidus]|uniref:hypothetical protein n=1 Tax=Vibrio splendidus TaxID=29497 RepID=UPI0006CA3445|nr:hypothetical protein [Vibrio splendidus]KPL97776.1 hypothetical protein AN167_21365 [Vibrio splendidus]